MNIFRGDRNFGVFLCFGLFWLFLFYVWPLYGFLEFGGFHRSATVHEFIVFVVYGFLKKLTDFGGNYDFGEVLYFQFFWMFLGYRWALYGFFDIWGLHSSATMLGFLVPWWFRGFLQGRLFFRETEVLVWFYAFVCFDCLWVKDGRFMDFVILGDSIALPRFIVLESSLFRGFLSDD